MLAYVTPDEIEKSRTYKLTRYMPKDADKINAVRFELEQWIAHAEFISQAAEQWLGARYPGWNELGAMKYAPWSEAMPVVEARCELYPYAIDKGANERYPISRWQQQIRECKRFVKGVNDAIKNS